MGPCNQVYATHFSQSIATSRYFDDDFKERYSSDKFNYEGEDYVGHTPPGSGNYEDFKNAKPKQKEQNNNDQLSINLGPLNWLFYLAIAGAVLFLIYILVNEGGSRLFSTKKNKTINSYDNITAENIEGTDINNLIKNAENNNDYRLAVRYYYLLVLKTLSIKNYIKFEDDKTNSEYLNEIRGKSFSKDFDYTSYLYNYIWYGKFHLPFEKYEKAKVNFETLLKQVEK
ncbi:hypothetical protein [uncultured Algibacter sp.]|uniref:hypothetical protein n=1 Tax=uncultured Algibacter sp. TaxID=298659 RepID=UPI002625F5B1|nr:hypothetical protein [uncultured Algibacter sp.]